MNIRKKYYIIGLTMLGVLFVITCDSKSNEPKDSRLSTYYDPIQPEKLKEDLNFLFQTIEEVHPNMYAYTQKETFSTLKNELYQEINRPMGRLEFYKILAPVIAALKNGHTFIQPFTEELIEFIKNEGKVFPLVLSLDDSKFVILENNSSDKVPLGGNVITINGQPVKKIFDKFACWFPSENKNINTVVVQRPEIFGWLLWLEYGDVESWTLEIKTNSGMIRSYVLRSASLKNIIENQRISNNEKQQNFVEYLPPHDAVRIHISSFSESENFKKFLATTFEEVGKKQISNIIIDVRKNPGGDDRSVDDLLEYLTDQPFRQFEKTRIKISPHVKERIREISQLYPKEFKNKVNGSIVEINLPFQSPVDNPLRFRGKIFVLIGPQSFSASTTFAAAIKCFSIGTLIGEETGDPTTLYADSLEFVLPNSKLQFMVASKQMISVCGDVNGGHGVLPDYEVKQKLHDTQNGIDTAFQFTLNLIDTPGNR